MLGFDGYIGLSPESGLLIGLKGDIGLSDDRPSVCLRQPLLARSAIFSHNWPFRYIFITVRSGGGQLKRGIIKICASRKRCVLFVLPLGQLSYISSVPCLSSSS